VQSGTGRAGFIRAAAGGAHVRQQTAEKGHLRITAVTEVDADRGAITVTYRTARRPPGDSIW